MSKSERVVILGVFVADTSYRADRQPVMGETILGRSFALGPGGKGSNQAVACARLGADAHFISKIGADDFGDLALKTWQDAGVKPAIVRTSDSYTGAAYIFVEESTGNNAIIVCPGAATTIGPNDIENNRDLIASSAVFVTQLEQPLDAAEHALRIARQSGVITILNPAPAADLSDEVFGLCDYMTPNETEAAALTGLPVETVDEARHAGDVLLKRGCRTALITLGEKGALIHNNQLSVHIPAISAGPVVETTGSGDAFNGGFAAALAWDYDPVEAVRFGCAVAGISVTRPGTAPSMPTLEEAKALYNKAQA